MEMDSKEHIAFCREQLFWQSYVNIDDGVLLLNVKRWTGGQLKMDREEDREEKFQSEGFELTGHGETLDCAIDFDIQFRYSGTSKLEDPKVWDGSSEFRPWMVQMCVNKKDPSSLLLTLEMEGMTFRELQVKGTWKLYVQLAIRSKSAKHLPLMLSMAKGSAGEILDSEAVEKEKEANQMNGIDQVDTSSDPGTAKELKPSMAHGPSSGPAEELKPLTGLPVSPDPGKITLSSGPGVGKKLKKRSDEEHGSLKRGRLLKCIVATLLSTLVSKKEIWKLFIFCIIVNHVEGCKSGAQVVENLKFLHPSATCSTQLEKLISCNGSLLSPVCLYSVPNDTHAWGCAPDICLNGNVCPEWNMLPNGSYVVQGGRRNCAGCPSFYHLSQLFDKEYQECYKSSQDYPRSTVAPTTKSTVAPTTESTVAQPTESTVAQPTESSVAPPTESTVAPTTKKMQALSTGGIVGIAFGLLAVIGASSVLGICIWKKRQVYRNPPTQNGEEMGMTEQLQNGLNGSTANGEHTRIGAD